MIWAETPERTLDDGKMRRRRRAEDMIRVRTCSHNKDEAEEDNNDTRESSMEIKE